MWAFCSPAQCASREAKLTDLSLPDDIGAVQMPASEIKQLLQSHHEEFICLLAKWMSAQEEMFTRVLSEHDRAAMVQDVKGNEADSAREHQQVPPATSLEQIGLEFQNLDDNSQPTCAAGVEHATLPSHVARSSARRSQEAHAFIQRPVDVKPKAMTPGYRCSLGQSLPSCIETKSQQLTDAQAAVEAATHSAPLNHAGSSISTCSNRSTKKSCLLLMLNSNAFEMVMAMVIISNSFFVGVQVEYVATERTDFTPMSFYALSFVYTAIFTIELILRISAERIRFFTSSMKRWNFLDIFIVTTSLFEAVVDIIAVLGRDSGNLSESGVGAAGQSRVIRIIRVARLLRIVRMARILRFVHALRVFICSIVATLQSLFWALALLFMILYVFGILFTQKCGYYMIDVQEDIDVHRSHDYNALIKYWGNLPRAIFTLFKSISGGVDWEDVCYPLSVLGAEWVGVFTCFIAFTYFAVLNVVTGIFCQHAIETASQNEDLLVHEQMANRALHVTRIQNLFRTMDDDESGVLTFDELNKHISTTGVQAIFEALHIDTSDAWTLFNILANSGKNEVNVDEFVTGLMHLKGNAKRIDLVEVKSMIRQVMSSLQFGEAPMHQPLQPAALS